MAARRGDIDRVSKMIAVEIIGLARRDHRMREGGHDVVPTHVRDAQGRCGVERAHRAADPAESGVATMFFARIGEQLHPDADAEEGRALPTHRSEEHTSELQSLMRISYAVFCLKKKKKTKQ